MTQIGFVRCDPQYAPPGTLCKSDEETKEFLETRKPKIVFFLPQNYIEFDNYEKPIQTYVDTTSFVMDLGTFNFYVCNMNL